jgi:hypothetical protein
MKQIHHAASKCNLHSKNFKAEIHCFCGHPRCHPDKVPDIFSFYELQAGKFAAALVSHEPSG